MSAKELLRVENLCKDFGELNILKDITESIFEEEVVCIIGPSGSGKSTFLRCLNMLEKKILRDEAEKQACLLLERVGFLDKKKEYPEMVKEVLEVIKGLALSGMTIIIVTHEMGFAREVSHHIMFMDNGTIAEQGTPDYIFNNAQNPRTIEFLSKVL